MTLSEHVYRYICLGPTVQGGCVDGMLQLFTCSAGTGGTELLLRWGTSESNGASIMYIRSLIHIYNKTARNFEVGKAVNGQAD